MSELKIKTVEDSKTEVSHLLFSKHMNSAGRLFGGQLLMWIDEVAGIVARRHCEGNLTTACIDNLQFKEPCYENDVIVIIGYVTHVGRSSMEIRIDTYVERPDGSRHPVNRAFFVMVALDANNKLEASDVNADGKVDTRDAVKILKKIVGFDVTLGEA